MIPVRSRMRRAVLMGLASIAAACSTQQSSMRSDSASTKEAAGQITDSIVPGGPNGAMTSSSSTPTTVTATPTRQAPVKEKRTGGEQDSAIQPKFSIDEKGQVRPIKH